MKKIKITLIALLVLTTGFFAIHCQHDDSETVDVVGPDPIVRGNALIACTTCNTSSTVSGVWYMDQNHSNVNWETRYQNLGSLLTGRFDQFFMTSLNFDEANPQNIAFEGYVWLNSVNTSEPGRDDGCLLTSFGTSNGLTDEAQNKAILKTQSGTGRYSTTDAGFLIDADLLFKGVTKKVIVKLLFSPYSTSTNNSAGFNAVFDINSDDYLAGDANRGSIGTIVRISINTTMTSRK